MTAPIRSGQMGGRDSVVSVKTTDTFAVNTRSGADVTNSFTAKCTAQQIVDSATIPGAGDMLKAIYDPTNVTQQLAGLTATQTLTNKTIPTHLDKATYDGAAIAEQLVGLTAAQTLTNKTIPTHLDKSTYDVAGIAEQVVGIDAVQTVTNKVDIESRRYALLNRGR